jgi:maleylpyruvate isomerase
VITEADGSEHTLTQSLPILEFLDERFQEAPLLGKDPYLRQRARALAEIINSGVQPFQNLATHRAIKALGSTDELAWSRPFLAEGLAAYERLARDVAGKFSVGDTPTLADCCLVPQIATSRRFGVDVSKHELLLAIEANCLALPAFANAAPDRQPDAVKS